MNIPNKKKPITELPQSQSCGRKDDGDKPRMELLPFDVLVEVAKVLTHGARKYAPENWKKVPMAKERYTGALLRHLAAWREGEQVDPESGLPHTAEMACNALFLAWFDLKEKITDQSRTR